MCFFEISIKIFSNFSLSKNTSTIISYKTFIKNLLVVEEAEQIQDVEVVEPEPICMICERPRLNKTFALVGHVVPTNSGFSVYCIYVHIWNT